MNSDFLSGGGFFAVLEPQITQLIRDSAEQTVGLASFLSIGYSLALKGLAAASTGRRKDPQ